MHVFLVRHAPSTKNIEGRQGAGRGPQDWSLTPDGDADARLFAGKLSEFVRFDAVYASPAAASVQTAAYVAEAQGLSSVLLEALRSIYLGAVSGMTDSEIADSHPSVCDQIRLYHAGFWHPRDYHIPDAETHRGFEDRVRSALQLFEDSGAERVCVVTHRSTITMALNVVANSPRRTDEGHYELINLAPLSLSVLEITNGVRGRILAAGRILSGVLCNELTTSLRNDAGVGTNVGKTFQYRLGIGFGTHDTSACLLRGRELLFAVEEEKLLGRKRTDAFPAESVRQCLSSEGIGIGQVETIALPADFDQHREALHWLQQVAGPDVAAEGRSLSGVVRGLDPSRILKALCAPESLHGKLRYYRHHTAHAASAYCLSGLRNAAVLVIDGAGECDTITIMRARGGSLTTVARAHFPHSLGKLYGAVCRYLGFSGHSKEGSVMALAGYGKARFLDTFRSFAEWSESLPVFNTQFFDFGLAPVHPSTVSQRFVEVFGEPRDPDASLTQHHIDIAASLQLFLEESVLRIAGLAHELTRENALCYAGGVALNCLANARLREASPFRTVFIPPGANDAGLSIGAAYLSLMEDSGFDGGEVSSSAVVPFFGASFTSADVLRAASELGLNPIEISSPSIVAARLLCADGVVGWIQGRLEFGPRALGNRSVLADPRRREIGGVLNKLIKDRESFRPFGPAVLLEAANDVFECTTPSPYMLDVFNVRAEWRPRIPSAVHVDGTARLQTVTAESNFLFYQLLRHFQEATGIPVVINTSFNGRDEPMAASPVEALKLFSRSAMPHVIVGNHLFSKKILVQDAGQFDAPDRTF